MSHADSSLDAQTLADWIIDARQRTLDLVADLTDEQLLGPRLETVNPLLWEIGHVAWFAEKWVLRREGRPSILTDADALYDSIAIPHDTRWDLPLPPRRNVLTYVRDVHDRLLDRLASDRLSADDAYFVQLAVFHEDMHTEAFTYTRQTLGYPAPRLAVTQDAHAAGLRDQGIEGSRDLEIPGGTFWLGAAPNEPFVFDNEKWAHPVEIKRFAIARTAVTQAEFAAFVDEGGYRHREFWSEAGWLWRESARAAQPMYWQRDSDRGWLRRQFDTWVPLEPNLPVVHVNEYEAAAYCRWAGRRLPSEAEWEAAAAAEPSSDGRAFSARRRRFPWGDGVPDAQRANLDWQSMGCIDVDALPGGDSAVGCRQMIGNVWEWTASDFRPYPGFAADPYQEYSQPWFGTHKVLRGGCWVTRARLLRNTWRNFYKPERRDVWAGFRTCAL
jgi:iron(II)-dependent oxidoreductase